jgi:hypothetical protein
MGPSPTPTSTPTLFPGGHNVVTLQQGVAGYQGTNDTYISGWTPQDNFGDQANLKVKNDGVHVGLLRFDLGSIPPGSTINQATLRVYAYYRDSTGTFDLEAYRLLRPWTDMQANWVRAAVDSPWGLPGANDTLTDRENSPSAVQTVSSVDAWYELDITQLAGDWVANPQANQGVLLRGFGQVSVVYHFGSANHATASLHPQLVIDYTAPETPITPTPGTPTPTGIATNTPTRTTTLTVQTPTRTPTGLASPTRTSTALPSPTPTVGPSFTPTTTPTPFPGGHNIVTLQQGVQGYQGTNDTYIAAWNPSGSFVYQANLVVKNDSVYAGLLRFDIGSIPPGSTINNATLRLFAYYRDQNETLDIEVYRMLRPWVDTEANWDRAAVGKPWGLPGVNDTMTDRAADPSAAQAVSALSTWYELDITQLVSDWVANPQTNHGVILRGLGYISLVYHFGSANHPTISLRPQLVIDYTAPQVPITPTPGTPTPTRTATSTRTGTPTEVLTPSATPSPTPSPIWKETTITLQQGRYGYTGSEDTYIHQYAPSSNYCKQDQFRVGYDQTFFGLVRFDLTSIPTSAIVTQATLQLYATGWGGADITVHAHCIKRDVNLCQATWSQAQDGDPWGRPGCNDTTTDRCADAESIVTSSGIRRWYDFDLTALVHAWVGGSMTNNGLLLRAPGSTSSLWFSSVQNPDVNLRPRLVITYRLAVTPTATPTLPVTPTMSPTPTATSVATATASPTATPTSSVTPTASPTPTLGAEERVADMERRVGILRQLIRMIIGIFRRASRIAH